MHRKCFWLTDMTTFKAVAHEVFLPCFRSARHPGNWFFTSGRGAGPLRHYLPLSRFQAVLDRSAVNSLSEAHDVISWLLARWLNIIGIDTSVAPTAYITGEFLFILSLATTVILHAPGLRTHLKARDSRWFRAGRGRMGKSVSHLRAEILARLDFFLSLVSKNK